MNIQEILAAPLEAPIPEDKAEQEQACEELVKRINKETIDSIFIYLLRLPIEMTCPIVKEEYQKQNMENRRDFIEAMDKSKPWKEWLYKRVYPFRKLKKPENY